MCIGIRTTVGADGIEVDIHIGRRTVNPYTRRFSRRESTGSATDTTYHVVNHHTWGAAGARDMLELYTALTTTLVVNKVNLVHLNREVTRHLGQIETRQAAAVDSHTRLDLVGINQQIGHAAQIDTL